jgi:hypothetical protein
VKAVMIFGVHTILGISESMNTHGLPMKDMAHGVGRLVMHEKQ